MSDERLDALKPDENVDSVSSYIKLTSIKLSNYKFFYGDDDKTNKFDFNGKNVLIYGENGTGKSSLYKALELLAKNKIEKDYFINESNVFSDSSSEITYSFTNGRNLKFQSDIEGEDLYIYGSFEFLKKLSVFKPMLDYKKLLKVHYTFDEKKTINVYKMLQELFKDYPVGIEGDKKLSEIKDDANNYFDELKNLSNNVLLNDINFFIEKYFDNTFKINTFEFKIGLDNNSQPEFIINLKIDFKDKEISNYHSFLNEARLSSLAIAIYFASIKKLFNLLENDCMKILVLDDLLISFDISNRLKLLEILKEEFKDFQIFFFTHDKELFDIYKNKLDWLKYELYLDDSESIPKSIIKKSDSYIEKAIEFYGNSDKKDYECSAFFLRKELERILKSCLPYKMKIQQDGEELDLSGLLSKAIIVSSGNFKNILENLDRDRKHILNPLSHDDNRNISSIELKKTIDDIKFLQTWKPKVNLILPRYTNLKFMFESPKKTIHNYFFNLNDDLWLYEKDGIPNITDCKCITIYCFEEIDGVEQKLKEFVQNYTSIFDIYEKIFTYKKIPIKGNYYEFFEYKNNEGKWKKFGNLINEISKQAKISLTKSPTKLIE